jgi:integration host factor subunit alpha
MRKVEIANALFERAGISRKEAGEILEMMLALIKETLQKGEPVKIAGFGNFLVRKKNKRVGRNPKTGEEVGITPRKVVGFKPSQEFKKAVAQERAFSGVTGAIVVSSTED